MDLGLRGLNALVTGGSRGIGAGIATTLAEEGANLALCARTEESLAAALPALRGHGGTVLGTALDVADHAALARWVTQSAQDLGGIDIVVANVSAFAIGDDDASWETAVNTDLLGTVRLIEAALPALRQSRSPSVVFVSSIAAREIDFAARPYGAIKAALTHYCKSLARSLGPDGIRVNVLTPGHTYFPGGGWERIARDQPDLYASSLSSSPIGRMASIDEIGRAAAFIASPAASFINGANLVADGGLTRAVDL